MEIKYRCDGYNGQSYRKYMSPYKCMASEMFEQENIDIPDTVNSIYCDGEDEFLNGLCEFIEDMDEEPSDEFVNTTIGKILEIVKEKTGKDVKFVLWLADEDSVRSHYADGVDFDEYPIMGFDITDAVVLSDLDVEGCLYGFETEPEPVEEITEKKLSNIPDFSTYMRMH